MTQLHKGLYAMAFAAVVAVACAAPQRPRELIDLETMRQQGFVEDARKLAAAPFQQAEGYYRQAVEAWKDDEPEQAREYSMLALMKLRTAEALVRQMRAKEMMASSEARARELNSERSKIEKIRQEIEEKNTLIEKLQAQGQKLSRGAATEGVNVAKLNLKNAESVMAEKFAPDEFKAAAELLVKAEAELAKNEYNNAAATAQLAREKAEKAFALSKTQYQQTQEAAAAKQRNEELLREAAGLPGVRPRREQSGELAKIVLPLTGLFQGRSTTLRADKSSFVGQVAELLKKYPTYQVIVEGHTDKRGTKGALLALSQTRAAAVHEALLMRGINARRMTVTGYGGERPSSDRRDESNRVEIVFILQ